MNKKVIIGICIGTLIVILSIIGWYFTHSKFDKSNPIIFEQQTNDDYAYIIYQGREYVPYSAINPSKRENTWDMLEIINKMKYIHLKVIQKKNGLLVI